MGGMSRASGTSQSLGLRVTLEHLNGCSQPEGGTGRYDQAVHRPWSRDWRWVFGIHDVGP